MRFFVNIFYGFKSFGYLLNQIKSVYMTLHWWSFNYILINSVASSDRWPVYKNWIRFPGQNSYTDSRCVRWFAEVTIVIRHWIAIYSDIFHYTGKQENPLISPEFISTYDIAFVCLVFFREILADSVLTGFLIISFLKVKL